MVIGSSTQMQPRRELTNPSRITSMVSRSLRICRRISRGSESNIDALIQEIRVRTFKAKRAEKAPLLLASDHDLRAVMVSVPTQAHAGSWGLGVVGCVIRYILVELRACAVTDAVDTSLIHSRILGDCAFSETPHCYPSLI